MYLDSKSPEAAALIVEDAESRIRLTVKEEYLRGAPWSVIDVKVVKIIRAAVRRIIYPGMKNAMTQGLYMFAKRQYRIWVEALGFDGKKAAAIILVEQGYRVSAQGDGILRTRAMGVSLQVHTKEYMKRVKAVFRRLAKERALDPRSRTARNTLHNLAEMETRHQDHQNRIRELRESGVRLVVCSVHADCSDRCYPWQGRVYSMDHTKGRTADGKAYVPLEEATDRYVTTKAGKTYKNGLLGYNCFDDQTEVLTNKGWRKFSELDKSEKVYTIDPKTRQTDWQMPIRYFMQYREGDMIHLHNVSNDIMVTPDHDLLYFTQKSSQLRFKAARDFTKGTLLYAGQEWNGETPMTVTLAGREVLTEVYCKFMAYWLADGSLHSASAVKIAQTNNEWMYNELKNLPFKAWRDDNKIVIHSPSLSKELSRYGRCTEKYVPQKIKNLSREYINVFLEAYLRTDGHIAQSKLGRPHLSLFTTSKQLAADLGELALKAGYRPSYNVLRQSGKQVRFRNGTYRIKHDILVINLNYHTGIYVLKKDTVYYRGYVYCVEVPNHTLLVRRNGKVVWCGNCRHQLYEYRPGMKIPTVTREQQQRESRINQRQRELEKEIRNTREEALLCKGLLPGEHEKLCARAASLNRDYKAFSKSHGRAYYPDRLKVMIERPGVTRWR